MEEFFRNLPSEIIIDILSRLPVRSIIRCKSVCKSWLDLVETHEFAKSHLSKSVPQLAFLNYRNCSESKKIFEFEDRLDLEYHELQYHLVTKLDLDAVRIQGSVNGLICMSGVSLYSFDPYVFYICNPITRDYIFLYRPQEFACDIPDVVTFGFGASKMTRQYKLVRIFHDCRHHIWTDEWMEEAESECQVYTLGKGSWRSIAPGAPYEYTPDTVGAFLNGNLHWLVYDLQGFSWISCFDLELELFGTFASPPFQRHERNSVGLFALGDCLWLSDSTSDDDIVIWLMKEYGVEKSWTKEFVISKNLDFPHGRYPSDSVRPIRVFKDDFILMAWGEYCLFYCKRSKTTQIIDSSIRGYYTRAIVHTPSFISLKSLGIENVILL